MNCIKFFLENFFNTLISVFRIIVLSKIAVKMKKNRASEDCIILANGPSLNDTLQNHLSFTKDKRTFCVNFFATTDFYQTIRPTDYVINAPELFEDCQDENVVKNRIDLFTKIQQQTQWDMCLYVINRAAKYNFWQKIIRDNPRIKIQYYNPTPVEGWKWFRHLMFRWNLGMPRPHNVLIPSIMIALNKGFKKIYLCGADHSWLSEISVDRDNNVLINQKHFYDENTSIPSPMLKNKKGIGKKTLDEVLMKFVYAFKGYFILNDYAKWLDAKIVNATRNSFIDAFERIDLEQSNK